MGPCHGPRFLGVVAFTKASAGIPIISESHFKPIWIHMKEIPTRARPQLDPPQPHTARAITLRQRRAIYMKMSLDFKDMSTTSDDCGASSPWFPKSTNLDLALKSLLLIKNHIFLCKSVIFYCGASSPWSPRSTNLDVLFQIIIFIEN